MPLRIVLHLDQGALKIYALVRLIDADISHVSSSAITVAHQHRLQAAEGVFELLLDRDIPHLAAKLVGKALPEDALARRLYRLHLYILKLVLLVLQHEAGVTASWYFLHHVLFCHDFAHDLTTSIHGILEAPRRLRPLLLLHLHVGEHGIPLLRCAPHFIVDILSVSEPSSSSII